VDRNESRPRKDQEQQGAELVGRVPAERVRGPGDVRPSELPKAPGRGVVPRAVEGVEVRARRWVETVRSGVPVADPAEVGGLDPRQVRLKRDPVEVLPSAERRTREEHRRRVQRGILLRRCPRSWPVGPIRDPVGVVVGRDAAADPDQIPGGERPAPGSLHGRVALHARRFAAPAMAMP